MAHVNSKKLLGKDTVDQTTYTEVKDGNIYVVNTVDALTTEDWTDTAWGSFAICIENKKIYVMNKSRVWEVFKDV